MALFSAPLFRYVLMAVRRDRIFQLMLVMMGLGAAVSLFLGGASTVEQQQYTLAMAGTVLRLVAVMGLIIFISFFLRRAFDSREIDYLLATPLTRHRLLFSFSTAFISISVLLGAAITVILIVMSHGLSNGLAVWGASAMVELMITAMMALFFATVLQSATISALCVFGFYSLARLIGMMIGIVENKLDSDGIIGYLMAGIVKIISVVIPRFDLLSQSAWIIYHKADLALWILPVQAFVFCTLFFVCAAFDLKRNQF